MIRTTSIRSAQMSQTSMSGFFRFAMFTPSGNQAV
jgi:hypothetical protein